MPTNVARPGGKPVQDQIHEKDTLTGTAPTTGLVNLQGPWSLCVEDVISEVVQPSSKLMAWIPSRGVTHLNDHVAHLSWIAPKDFDGSESYMDYLAALDPLGNCDYGPAGTDWNACEYTHTMHRISFQSEVITRTDFGQLECERSPIYRLRGPNSGMPLDNDADWALARAGFRMENHMNWNLLYGDPAVGPLMYDGLDTVIDTGWVAAHAIGNGSCDFTDPLVMNGTALDDADKILRAIKGIVRKIRQRAADRGYRLTPSDYALVMPRAIWAYLADAIACGSMTGGCSNLTNLYTTTAEWFSERARITTGYLGDGFIDVDGQPVPVMTDNIMGANTTVDGDAAVVGDIYLLTKSFAGLNILEHQYLDWNQLKVTNMGANVPALQIQEEIYQNGLLRAGWIQENQRCFQYFTEMFGRIVTRFQPLQAKITDVVVKTILSNENEAPSFVSPDFYAYNGAIGGQGNTLLTGLA